MLPLTPQILSQPILASKTYLLCLGIPPSADVETVTDAFGICIRWTQNLEEFTTALAEIKNLLGIIIDSRSSNLIPNRNTQSAPWTVLPSSAQNPKPETVIEIVCGYIQQRLPLGAEKLAVAACDYVFAHFIPIPVKFSSVHFVKNRNFTHKVLFESLQKPYAMRITLRFNISEVQKRVQSLHNMQERKVLDVFKEFGNQLTGVITHNLSTIGIFARVGIPITAEIKQDDGHSVHYLPSLELIDLEGLVHVSFALINLESSEKIDLSRIQFNPSQSEVEYL